MKNKGNLTKKKEEKKRRTKANIVLHPTFSFNANNYKYSPHLLNRLSRPWKDCSKVGVEQSPESPLISHPPSI